MKIVIFDLDGTILNTLDDLTNSANYALEINNLPKRTREEIRTFVGNGIRKLIENAVPDTTTKELTDKIFSDFSAYYKGHCTDKTVPYEGITESLNYLKINGYKTAVVSNKADFAVQGLCRQFFDNIFDYVVGEKEGIRRKPYPDSVLEVIKYFNVEKQDAIYIGDSEVDIKTAQNAGINSILVDWGFRDKTFLINHGASSIVSTASDMIISIEQIFSKKTAGFK